MECIQTDNGFEFTNRFSRATRHNGKAERSHREDQRRFYDSHSFYSLPDFDVQPTGHRRSSNNRPMRPLHYNSSIAFLRAYTVQLV